MVMYSRNRSENTGLIRLPFAVCLTFLFLLVLGGPVSADSMAAATTVTQERTGGSIYFETFPSGARVWVDAIEIGTSPFTYYSEKTGTMDVRAWKKGYENYSGQVTVIEGTRVVFSAVLKEVPRGTIATPTFAVVVTTATTIRKSTLIIPTTWPATSAESPADAAVVIGAATLGIVFFVIRRR